METIRITLSADGVYLATFYGCAAHRVRQLFGTDTIPTAFRLPATIDTVRAAIREKNPTATIIYRPAA